MNVFLAVTALLWTASVVLLLRKALQ